MDDSVPNLLTCRKFQFAVGGYDRQENEHALVADATAGGISHAWCQVEVRYHLSPPLRQLIMDDYLSSRVWRIGRLTYLGVLFIAETIAPGNVPHPNPSQVANLHWVRLTLDRLSVKFRYWYLSPATTSIARLGPGFPQAHRQVNEERARKGNKVVPGDCGDEWLPELTGAFQPWICSTDSIVFSCRVIGPLDMCDGIYDGWVGMYL